MGLVFLAYGKLFLVGLFVVAFILISSAILFVLESDGEKEYHDKSLSGI